MVKGASSDAARMMFLSPAIVKGLVSELEKDWSFD